MLNKTWERITRAIEWIVIVLVAALVVDVWVQVITRRVLNDPSTKTDELAVLLMIWLTLLGASAAFIRRGHLGVDFLVRKLPARWQAAGELVAYAGTLGFAGAILIYGGLKLVSLTLLTEQVSALLRVRMGHVYLALPISGCLIAAFSAGEAARRLAKLRGGRS